MGLIPCLLVIVLLCRSVEAAYIQQKIYEIRRGVGYFNPSTNLDNVTALSRVECAAACCRLDQCKSAMLVLGDSSGGRMRCFLMSDIFYYSYHFSVMTSDPRSDVIYEGK